MFFLKIEKKTILDFFPFAVSRRLLSESSGHGLNCNVFEYLMMYQFDFTDIIITILYHIFLRYFYTRHTLVSGYYVIPFFVYPSVRPCSPFPIDNLSICSRNFFKFCIHIVIGDEWYGIVNGQNPSIFNGVTALFRIGKMVSGLLFLYCS